MLRGGVLAALLLCVASAAGAQTLPPLPAQPAGVAWPTHEWATADLPATMDRPAFDLAMTEAFAGPNPGYGQTHAVLIIQHGRIVYERYADGFTRDTRLVSWSMAKSFTQAFVGAAMLQGRVAADAPMGNPHWAAGDRRASTTWRQWLNMVDGLNYKEGGGDVVDWGNANMLFGAGHMDPVAWAAERAQLRDPGTHWNYSSAGLMLVSDALTRAIVPNPHDVNDRRTRMRAWMNQSLFDPIGMHPVVEFDPQGTFYGSSLIWATARDFARFGYLYLHDGVWDGHRLVPEGWVDFARSRGPDTNTDVYGAGWWLTPGHGTGSPEHALLRDNRLSDVFSAQGYLGQLILVAPSRDLVIVRLGQLPGDTPGQWDSLGDWCAKVILAFDATH